jgi:SAM-dependent methyltransferase
METAYVLDTSDPAERTRLDTSSRLWDPFTRRVLADTPVLPGWRCLEVGAGTGSLASWLLRQVGPAGHVMATDIDTRWLVPLQAPNLEIRRHDAATDPIEAEAFDLVHARLLLEHLPDPTAAVARLAGALRPGGWLVVEDYDVRTCGLIDPPDARWGALGDGIVHALERVGVDALLGSRLQRLLLGAGLDRVVAEGQVRLLPMAELAPIFAPVIDRLRPAILASGALSEADLDTALAVYDDDSSPPVTGYTPILMSARGQRP